MTRPALIVFACGLLTAVAAAQTAPFEISILAPELTAFAVVHTSNEVSCSQSSQNTSSRTQYTLAVTGNGATTLTGNRNETSITGGSRMEIDRRPPTVTTRLASVVLRGHATLARTRIDVRFTESEQSEIAIQGYGTLPLPPATRTRLTTPMTMRCEVRAREVLPAMLGPTPGRGTSHSLLMCDLGSAIAPFFDSSEVTQGLAFARSAAVQSVRDRSMGRRDETFRYRLAN